MKKNLPILKWFGGGKNKSGRDTDAGTVGMEQLAMVAIKSNNSVIITDSIGSIEWVNEGFVKLTGYTLSEVRGTHGEVLRKGQATGLSPGSEHFQTAIYNRKPVSYESKNYTKEGKEYCVTTTITPVLDSTGQIDKLIVIDSDITERKRMEEELIIANRIAEHSLIKGSKALNELMKAKQELEKSMKVKEEFLAKVSHEIRTPMTAVMGIAELLEGTNLTGEQREYVEAISVSSANLLSVINDILDFSKLEAGKMTFEQIPFNPAGVLDEVRIVILPAAEKKSVNLRTYIPDNLPAKVIGDPTRLRQILLNLAGNSIKFTEQGSVDLAIELSGNNGELVSMNFIVRDTGIGIPGDKINSIYDSFTQASNDTSRKYGGTGLGLSIAKQLVHQQGGSIEVESEVGRGTVFRVQLSYEIEKGTHQRIETSEPGMKNISGITGARILVAEDNRMNQLLIKRIFEKWGIESYIVSNGNEVIEALNADIYDLILMDVQMPLMDGYRTTRYIRSEMSPVKSKIPIIAMTAHAFEGTREKCREIGMNDYISKPYNQKTLLTKIAEWLGKSGAELYVPETDDNVCDGESVVNLDYLHRISEGNEEFVEVMIRTFLEETPEALYKMRRSVSAADWNMLADIAHKLKPALDFMGIENIRLHLSAIEKQAKLAGNKETVPDLVMQVCGTLEAAMEELRRRTTVDS